MKQPILIAFKIKEKKLDFTWRIKKKKLFALFNKELVKTTYVIESKKKLFLFLKHKNNKIFKQKKLLNKRWNGHIEKNNKKKFISGTILMKNLRFLMHA